ncbi:DNA excision repair protein ERCC-8 [Aphelenchoides avenae]|nr:DNA excision repair protein ERCC-8 [Aphelenchus avenae]
MTIVDLGESQFKPENAPIGRTVISGKRGSAHQFLVTSCQWYPLDSSLFVTGSMDQYVKVWDPNRMVHIDKYKFDNQVFQVHWSPSRAICRLIAVANGLSNIPLLDPRLGSAAQHIRWKTENAKSVHWLRGAEYILVTGGVNGSVALWDVRSGRSELAHLRTGRMDETQKSFGTVESIRCTADGLHLVTFSLRCSDALVQVWNAQTLKNERRLEVHGETVATQLKTLTTIDICDEGRRLWALVPSGNDLVLADVSPGHQARRALASDEVDESVDKPVAPPMPFFKRLRGHLHRISGCVYRRNYQQAITCSTDRTLLVWAPSMDEVRADEEEKRIHELHEDAFSDED